MPPRLSVRQEQCVRLTAFRTDKEIAAHLGISEATVKKHVHEACRRLGVNRRKAALAILEQQGPKHPNHAVVEEPSYDNSPPKSQEPSQALNDEAVPGGGHGYRVPPRGLLFRLTLIIALAVLICALLMVVLWMVGEIHRVVGHLDPQSA